MHQGTPFDPRDFLPYLLNMAAEESGLRFEAAYKDRYGMLRTEWRVLFHLGRYGEMTAKDICDRARIHKTKVSRAVARLENRRFLRRTELEADRRQFMLRLTPTGQSVFRKLSETAHAFNEALSADFTEEEQAVLRRCLRRIARLTL